MKYYFYFSLFVVFFAHPWIPLNPTQEGVLQANIHDVLLDIRVTHKIFNPHCCMIDLYKTLQIHWRFSDETVRYETLKYEWGQVSLEDSGKFKRGFVSDNLLFFVLYGLGGDFLICRLPGRYSKEMSPIMLYNSRGHVDSQATFVQFPDNETVHIINREKTILFTCNTARCEYELLVPYDIEEWSDYMGCC